VQRFVDIKPDGAQPALRHRVRNFARILAWNDVLFVASWPDRKPATAWVARQVFGATQEGALPSTGSDTGR
jgi:hypothetical protein